MNLPGFILRKLGTQLGVIAPRRFIRQATDDATMLEEAEGIIGGLAWRQLENVDDIAAEYWKLRLIENETHLLKQRLLIAEMDSEAYAKRGDEVDPELQNAFDISQKKLDDLILEQQNAVNTTADLLKESDTLRHHYSGIKLKLRVLRDEDADPARQEEIRKDMARLRQRYDELAQLVAAARENSLIKENYVHAEEIKIENIQLEARRRQQAIAREITERNLRVVDLKSRIGVLNKEKLNLLHTIGKLLCSDEGNHSDLQKERHRLGNIISKAKRLKRSIQYQRRLGELR
jgi:hypothetical protein